MSNTLTAILHTILARGLVSLRETCLLPQIINSDYSLQAAEPGTSITVPVPVSQTAANVTPAETPPAPADKTPDSVSIALNQWKKTEFHLTDKEELEIMEREHFLPMQTGEALRALSNAIQAQVYSKYTGIYGYSGTAATTPFATLALTTAARATLNSQLAPFGNRSVLCDFTAGANALALAGFVDASQSADSAPIKEGVIGRKMGFNWYEDAVVPSHTTGAAGTWLVDQADVAIGDTGIHCDGATTTASVGDVFTVDGDSQTYTIVTSGTLATTDVDITFQPAAKVAWVDSAAMTFKATHVLNLMLHRNSFALAMRPLARSGSGLANSAVMQDPVSGLVVRLEVTRQYKQTVWEFDACWGSALVRPELAIRVAG